MSESQFLSLPGEIRNQIYNLLLIVPSPGGIRLLGQSPSIHPQILSVCRQTYQEGREILYGCNTFIAHHSLLSSMPQLRRWQNPITSCELIALIKRYHIYVRLDCDARFTAEAARQAFAGVEELTVEVFQAQFRNSDYKVLRLFEDIRGVKKAKVVGSVASFPEYTAWLEGAMMSPEGAEATEFQESREDLAGDLWARGGP